jgi:hypothetical protein
VNVVQLLALLRARMPQRAVTADVATPDKPRRYGSRHAPRASIPDDWRHQPARLMRPPLHWVGTGEP